MHCKILIESFQLQKTHLYKTRFIYPFPVICNLLEYYTVDKVFKKCFYSQFLVDKYSRAWDNYNVKHYSKTVK